MNPGSATSGNAPRLADRPLPKVPDWLRKKQTAGAKKLKAKVADHAQRIPVNERHDAIGVYIGGLRRRNPELTEDEALDLAHAFRVKRCERPEEKVDDVDRLVAYIYAKDPPAGDAPWQGRSLHSPSCSKRCTPTSRATSSSIRSRVTPSPSWVAHTYVYDCARATPYLHFHSPEPGSGKTAALEVLQLVCRPQSSPTT